VSVAGFIATQRTGHGVPHATACRALGVSQAWFYKWRGRPPTARAARRARLAEAVRAEFAACGRTYGSPRITAELRAKGWRVGENTVAAVMAELGLAGRPKHRRRSLTRPDRGAAPAPDLLHRDFTAAAPNVKWCGDLTEIPNDEGPLYLASTEDLFSRRLLGFALGTHHDAELAVASIKMATAVRGGSVAGVIFHSDRGSEYTADAFGRACARLGITQSMGRVGSALDNAAAESFFSTLEHELLSRHHFTTREQARRVVAGWIDGWYNRSRRHSTAQMLSPYNYEQTAAAATEAAA